MRSILYDFRRISTFRWTLKVLCFVVLRQTFYTTSQRTVSQENFNAGGLLTVHVATVGWFSR